MTEARHEQAPFGTLHLEHASTVDRVAGELRRAIFDGEVESGPPLREVAIAASLGVSRPTVREALTILVPEGLATREPNRGVSVASPQAAATRNMVSVVSPALSPLESSTSPTRMHRSSTCCTCASSGTRGPSGRISGTVGGPARNSSCASRLRTVRTRRVRRRAVVTTNHR